MRILFVIENFPVAAGGFKVTGGVEAAALSAARWLAKSHDVRVITNLRPGAVETCCEDIHIQPCGSPGTYTQNGGFLQRATFQRQAVRAGVALKPDIVVGWNFISYPPAHRIARRCGVPCVAWYADVWVGEWMKLFGLPGLLGEFLERRVLRQDWDRFIAISDYTQKKLLARGIAAERIEIIPPIVDLGQAGLPAPSLRAEDDASIIVVSRLVDYKRVDVAIRAVARLVPKYSHLRLGVIGQGPQREHLEQLACHLGIRDRVTWHGYVSQHRDVLLSMAQHKIYVTASQVEGFGISTIEAAGMGLAFVASDIPAIRYATRGGQGGFLFSPGDDQACAAAIDQLLGNSKLYREKLEEGQGLISLYSPQCVGRDFEESLVRTAGATRGSRVALLER